MYLSDFTISLQNEVVNKWHLLQCQPQWCWGKIGPLMQVCSEFGWQQYCGLLVQDAAALGGFMAPHAPDVPKSHLFL